MRQQKQLMKKQYFVTLASLGAGVGIAFTRAEEARLLKAAKRAGITMQKLIDQRLNAAARKAKAKGLSYDECSTAIARAAYALGRRRRRKVKR